MKYEVKVMALKSNSIYQQIKLNFPRHDLRVVEKRSIVEFTPILIMPIRHVHLWYKFLKP